MSELLQTGADDKVEVLVFQDDAAWDALTARGGRWFQLADADLRRLFLGRTIAEGTDAYWEFDPESVRGEWEERAGGPVILIY